jgi:hypothetical protein
MAAGCGRVSAGRELNAELGAHDEKLLRILRAENGP